MAALPWFAFNLEDYTASTMHFTTEEHGAYLLMMLAYYRTLSPLPASDRALSSLTKLPMDRWLECKPTLQAKFVTDASNWVHERIEKELLAASSKHAAAVAKATAAAQARHGKPSSPPAKSVLQAVVERTPSRKRASSQPGPSSGDAPSKPDASSSSPHLQEHITLSVERVIAPEAPKHDDNSTKAIDRSKEEGFNPLGTTLSETWVPDAGCIATAEAYGMKPADLEAEVLTFHAYNAERGTFSKNWSATWQMWCARWKEREATKPKTPAPRVEVNHQPSDKDWDRACELWARGGSVWSFKSLGPDPQSRGCRCPEQFLTKHGIDPATGQWPTKTKEPVS